MYLFYHIFLLSQIFYIELQWKTTLLFYKQNKKNPPESGFYISKTCWQVTYCTTIGWPGNWITNGSFIPGLIWHGACVQPHVLIGAGAQ